MIGNLKYLGVLFLVLFELNSGTRISGKIDASHPNEPLLFLRHTNKTNVRSDGIFVTFLHNLFELLTTKFPEKKLPLFCRILSRYMSQLDYRYTKKLAKHLRRMSRMYRDELKDQLIVYQHELEEKRQHQMDFLQAMDKIFTLQEKIRFDDYVYELNNYGNDDILFIDKETEKLVNDVIIKSIMRQSSKDRSELHKKLKRAIKEYNKSN